MELPWTRARDLRQAARRHQSQRLVDFAAAVRAAGSEGKDYSAWHAAMLADN